MNEDKSPYVTYKWLIGSILSTFVLMVSILGIMFGVLSSALSSKVNLDLYQVQQRELRLNIDEVKTVVNDNAKALNRFEQNQLLVLRHLKIPPVGK